MDERGTRLSSVSSVSSGLESGELSANTDLRFAIWTASQKMAPARSLRFLASSRECSRRTLKMAR